MKLNFGPYVLKVSFYTTLFFLSILALLITLGLWQLGRAEEKRQLQQLKKASVNKHHLNLPSDLPVNSDLIRYRKVQLKGIYDSDHQLFIDNQIIKGKPGYFVMTPFIFSNSSDAVLVNRGWVPLNKDRSLLPDISFNQQTEEITINGRINTFPSVGIKLQGAEIPTKGWPAVVQVVDIGVLIERLGYPLLNFQIELHPDLPQGFYRQWQEIKLLTPEKHTAYAFQWFALAVTLCVLFFWYSCRKINE